MFVEFLSLNSVHVGGSSISLIRTGEWIPRSKIGGVRDPQSVDPQKEVVLFTRSKIGGVKLQAPRD